MSIVNTLATLPVVKRFIKPVLKGKLLGNEVKVTATGGTKEEIVLILFGMVQNVAKGLGMDYRALLNNMLKMDSAVKRIKKQEVKERRYGKKN